MNVPARLTPSSPCPRQRALGRALTGVAILALSTGWLGCAQQKAVIQESAPTWRTAPAEPFRAERPPAGPEAALTLPRFQEATLQNGLRVIVSENHALPVVQMQFVLRAGSVSEKASDAGLSALTFDLLDEGAGKMSALGLSEAFGNLGTQVATGSGLEAGYISLGILRRNLEPGLDLVAAMVQRPTFASEDFKRVQERHLSALKQRAGQPDLVAGDVFASGAYGSSHPYGQPGHGTALTLKKLSPRQVKKFWKRHAVPGAAALVFAGDVTLDEAVALAEKAFGKWRGKVPKRPALPDPAASALAIRLVDAPGAPQTVVRVGRAVLRRGDEDEAAMAVMNQILGGMFSSRLNMNLREAKGWTYGAFSSVHARAALGPLVAGANIQRPHSAAALREVLAEFARLRREAVTEEELQVAKGNYVRSLPGLFDTVESTCSAGASLFVQDLPLDHYGTWAERVMAVRAADVQQAAGRALAQEGLVVVMVGDASEVKPALEALSLGDVQVVSPSGEAL